MARLRPPPRSPVPGRHRCTCTTPGSMSSQASEELADLGARPRRDRENGLLVIPLHPRGHLVSGDVARDLRDGKITALHHRIHQPRDDGVRPFLVGDALQDPQQHDRDRLPEVQDAGRPLQDRAGVAQIGVDVGSRALRAAGQQKS